MLSRLKSRITYANVAASIALFVSLSTGGVYAAHAFTGADIVNGSLKNVDIATNTLTGSRIKNESLAARDLAPNSVGSSEIASGAVHSSDIANNSVTTADLKGADVNGALVNLPADAVLAHSCLSVAVNAPGALPGEAVVITLQSSGGFGLIFYGNHVSTADIVIMAVCNVTNVNSPAVTNLPIRVITFG